jgi:hypothetical protein
MLTGSELKSKVKSLDGQSRAAVVRACGYEVVTKAGKKRLEYAKFDKALIEAHGHVFAGGERLIAPRYMLHVTKQGLVTVGAAYLRSLEVDPGDLFAVTVDPDKGQVLLQYVTPEEAEAAAQAESAELAVAA